MKRTFAILTILATFCSAGFAQSAKDIISEMKDLRGAEYTHIPRMLMSVASTFAKEAKGVYSIRTVSLDKVSTSESKRIAKKIGKLGRKGYHTLVKSKDGDEQTCIMTKTKKGNLRELFIFDNDDEGCELVLLTGKMPLDKLPQLVKIKK